MPPDLRAALRGWLEGEPPPQIVRPMGPSALGWMAPLAIRLAAEGADMDFGEALALLRPAAGDPLALACALAFGEALRRALGGQWDDWTNPRQPVAELAEWTRALAPRIAPGLADRLAPDAEAACRAAAETLLATAGLLAEGNAEIAAASIAAEASRGGAERAIKEPQAPHPAANLAWAVYLAARDRRTDRAMSDALGGGREAPSIAAMTGALAGAMRGAEALPAAWRRGLLASALIERRAEALASGNPAAIYEDDLAAAEAEWTRIETQGRARRFEEMQAKAARREERHGTAKAGKTAPGPAAPPSTYARADPPVFDQPDPEQARREKARRGKKRIEWKEQRRASRRRGE